MAVKALPSPELLRQLLDLNKASGVLTWKARSREFFKSNRSHSVWNVRFAGKPAMTTLRHGYRVGRILDLELLSHRVIWAMVYDEWPETIDHIDGNRENNRIDNLRSVAKGENARNVKRSRANTSGVTGVHWSAFARQWTAQIKAHGSWKFLGYFRKFEDAVAARKSAEQKFGFHPNHGRN